MFTEAISAPILKLLQRLNSIPDMSYCYLGGGTALALQLGHRKSEDLDFFVPEGCAPLAIVKGLQESAGYVLVVNQSAAHIELLIDRIKVDFISERIPLRFPLKTMPFPMVTLKMADARDIGRMKLFAIASRGNKKDFVDLFCLIKSAASLESLIALAESEHKGLKYSKLIFLKGLVDFEEADQEPAPIMIWHNTWSEIKENLKDEVRRIARKIQSESL